METFCFLFLGDIWLFGIDSYVGMSLIVPGWWDVSLMSLWMFAVVGFFCLLQSYSHLAS